METCPDAHSLSNDQGINHSERTRYGFVEAFKLTKRPPFGPPKEYCEKFLKNLNLKAEAISSDARALLERYVANVHVNCSWYNNKVRSEKLLQATYFAISVALLFLVPLLIYFSPHLFEAISSQFVQTIGPGSQVPDEITARLTTSLAGFFFIMFSMRESRDLQ